eukprot:PhM_4_TR17082/c0_g1_i2/m.58527
MIGSAGVVRSRHRRPHRGHGAAGEAVGCIGGFVLNYFRDFGLEVPQYDFGVEGVSSISLDLHKYAYCAKGASVLLYRSRELRRYAIFACAEWYGYPIFNPTVGRAASDVSSTRRWPASTRSLLDADARGPALSLLE